MALANKDISSIYDGLIYKFLYKNDINCIHILLNLYDLEENITNICPKYITINNLKKRMNSFLRTRKDNYFISLKLGQLIHEEINRLELFIYLEGYRHGYFNNCCANLLEKITLKNIPVEKLYNFKYLYHFDTNIQDVIDFKKQINKEIQEKEKTDRYLYDKIIKYSNFLLKSKIFNLNNFLDKQLTIDYNSNKYKIKDDEEILNLDELNNIYRETVKVVLKNCLDLYKESYWYGLNDRVLKRYR